MYHSSQMAILMLLFSWINRIACRFLDWSIRLGLRSPHTAPIPVISIGNITHGGSGKTPLAVDMLSFLLENGYDPALISRGYKGRWEQEGGILSLGKGLLGGWEDAGDEAVMTARNVPRAGVFLGKHRLLSCLRAYENGFHSAVLDDGFQHRRLARDIDIVLCDRTHRWELRESPSALGRADFLLLNRSLDPDDRRRFVALAPRARCYSYGTAPRGLIRLGQENLRSVREFMGETAVAFSAIARPERFFSLLEQIGIVPFARLSFPDHHAYPPPSRKRIRIEFEESGGRILITTEKDAVKLSSFSEFTNLPVYYLKIGLEIDNGFYEEILTRLAEIDPPTPQIQSPST